MKYITKQETVEALKELFGYENNKESKNVLVVLTFLTIVMVIVNI